MMACGRFKELMMASLDGEISAEDRAELESHLAECDDCRREFAEHTMLSELVGEIELTKPSQEDMMKYWPSVYAKIERGAGWGLGPGDRRRRGEQRGHVEPGSGRVHALDHRLHR